MVEEGDFEAQTLEGSSETQPDQSTAILAARMALTQILLSDGMKNFSSGAAKVLHLHKECLQFVLTLLKILSLCGQFAWCWSA